VNFCHLATRKLRCFKTCKFDQFFKKKMNNHELEMEKTHTPPPPPLFSNYPSMLLNSFYIIYSTCFAQYISKDFSWIIHKLWK
jgi:hypothetical protein